MTRVPSLQATVCSSVAGFKYCKLSVASPFVLVVAAVDDSIDGDWDRVTPNSNDVGMDAFTGV